MAETHDSLMSVRMAAAVAGVHRATIAKWVARGDLRVVQRDPQILIDREDLDRFLRHRNQATDASDASPASTFPLDEFLMANTHDAPNRLTTKEAAAVVGVHHATIAKWVARGSLRAVQREPQILIDREDLEQFLRRQKEPAESGNQPPTAKAPSVSRSARTTVASPVDNPLVFGRKDAAVLLGVAPDTINRWRREGRLHATAEGEIPLAEIERIIAASMPADGPQLELLLREPTSQTPEDAGGQLPPWLLLARLLEASHQREVKLNDLLSRTLALLETRSKRLSGDSKPIERQLTNRVLTFLQSHSGPHSSGEIREALDLPENPRDALGKLVKRKLIKRLSPGVFEAIPEPSKSDPPLEPAEGTLMAKVLAYVRQMTGEGSSKRGVVSWEVQQALDLPQSPNRTLSRLNERGLIYRVREGFYSARPLEVEEKREFVEEEKEKADR